MTQLTHPLNAIPSDKRARVFVPLLIATLVITFLFRFIGPAQPTIVDFELAGSVQKAQAIIDAWNETDRIRAGFSLGFDYLYMPVYSTTIALACLLAAGVLKTQSVAHHRPAAGVGLVDRGASAMPSRIWRCSPNCSATTSRPVRRSRKSARRSSSD